MNNEQIVRMLDDPSKKVIDLARNISQRLRLTVSTCARYLYVKREGYDSTADYANTQAKKQGFNSKTEAQYFRVLQKKYGSGYTLEQFRASRSEDFDEELTRYLRTDSLPLNSLKNKLSKTEQIVKKLDNPQLTVADSAKIVSKKTGIECDQCLRYISDLRHGITGTIHADFLARRKGFVGIGEKSAYDSARSKNSELTPEQFRTNNAKRDGFSSLEAYTRFLDDRRLFFQHDSKHQRNQAQKKFEYADIEIRHPKEIDKMQFPKDKFIFSSEDREALWQFLESQLNEKEYKVLQGLFLEEKTLNQVGKDFGVTRERIRQIEYHAIRKLRHPCRFYDFISFYDVD